MPLNEPSPLWSANNNNGYGGSWDSAMLANPGAHLNCHVCKKRVAPEGDTWVPCVKTPTGTGVTEVTTVCCGKVCWAVFCAQRLLERG